MVVDPGQEKVPAEDIQAQTIRLNMVHGADLGSVKRNKIPHSLKTGTKRTAMKLMSNKKSIVSSIKNSNKVGSSSSLLTVGLKRNKNVKFNKNNKSNYKNKQKTLPNKRSKFHRDTNAAKKSNVNEKEMRVQGQSGHLRVHTDHNVTAVNSQSGKLEIYIKNPDHHFDAEEHAAEHHSKVTVEVVASEAYKKNNLMKSAKLHNSKTNNGNERALLHIADITGVKKSNVIPKRMRN